MKCLSCDVILTEAEDAVRFAESGARVGLCTACSRWLPSDVPRIGDDELSEIPEEDEYDTLEVDTEVDEEDEDFLL